MARGFIAIQEVKQRIGEIKQFLSADTWGKNTPGSPVCSESVVGVNCSWVSGSNYLRAESVSFKSLFCRLTKLVRYALASEKSIESCKRRRKTKQNKRIIKRN